MGHRAGADATYELSHAGRLENTLTGMPFHRAALGTPRSGNVAVMGLFGGGAGPVCGKGKGSPHAYENKKQYYYDFGGYDPNGNLFFDGRSASGTFMLSELPKGGKSAYTIAISGGTIYFPGMVQWDSSNSVLVVGDQSCGSLYTSCLYTVKVAGKTGTIESTIGLQNASGGQVCDLIQGVIYNGQLAGSDNDICGSAPSTTYVWPYPCGRWAGGVQHLDRHHARRRRGEQMSIAKPATTLFACAFLLAGCGSVQLPSSDAGVRQSSPVSDRKGLAKADLIYVSDADSEVTVYNFSQADTCRCPDALRSTDG